MDETTQQNAALVEQTTSASQSMKEQAKGLIQQVAAFKVNGQDPPRQDSGSVSRVEADGQSVRQPACWEAPSQ